MVNISNCLRKNNMRRFIALFLTLFCLAVPAHAAPPLPKPQILAVYFYADWCPRCQNFSPVIAKARTESELDKKNVLFVTFNLTNKNSIHQSILLAQALGIGDYLKKQGSGTGYLALLNAGSKKEISRFESETTAENLAKSILDALGEPKG